MAIALLPLFALAGAAYVVSEQSSAIKRRKSSGKARFIKAAQWLQDEVSARRQRAEDDRWRVLKREDWVPFRPVGPARTRTSLGNVIIVRVGTKDRADPAREKNNLLYPMSASDNIGYNYYKVVNISENQYDLDQQGKPIQKEVMAEKLYQELPGPARIGFYRYPMEGDIYIDSRRGDYACASCSFMDAALMEFTESGNVIGFASAQPSAESIDIIKGRFPRPGDLTKTQRLSAVWQKLNRGQIETVRGILGDDRSDRLEKILDNGGPDKDLMDIAYEMMSEYKKLSRVDQGKVVFRAQSSLGKDNVLNVIDVLLGP